jgi:hypothetical protein
VVVPLTADGRLSAKDVFNPKTLRALQTEYAEAMKPFGMERGVEHSRAKHEVMRHVYGAQERSRGELATLTKPEPATRLRIEGPSGLDLVNLSKWRAEQDARLNAELTWQLAAANERASKAASIAQDSAGAKDREKTLARQLASVEGTKTKEIGRRESFEGGDSSERPCLRSRVRRCRRKCWSTASRFAPVCRRKRKNTFSRP